MREKKHFIKIIIKIGLSKNRNYFGTPELFLNLNFVFSSNHEF